MGSASARTSHNGNSRKLVRGVLRLLREGACGSGGAQERGGPERLDEHERPLAPFSGGSGCAVGAPRFSVGSPKRPPAVNRATVARRPSASSVRSLIGAPTILATFTMSRIASASGDMPARRSRIKTELLNAAGAIPASRTARYDPTWGPARSAPCVVTLLPPSGRVCL
jgi:hypothetical protein